MIQHQGWGSTYLHIRYVGNLPWVNVYIYILLKRSYKLMLGLQMIEIGEQMKAVGMRYSASES